MAFKAFWLPGPEPLRFCNGGRGVTPSTSHSAKVVPGPTMRAPSRAGIHPAAGSDIDQVLPRRFSLLGTLPQHCRKRGS
jgi:hypothetical protein